MRRLLLQAHELHRLSLIAAARPPKEAPDADAVKKADAAQVAMRARLVAATTVGTQALVAASLLKLIPLQPRSTAALGVLTSALACYQLLPPLPQVAKAKEA